MLHSTLLLLLLVNLSNSQVVDILSLLKTGNTEATKSNYSAVATPQVFHKRGGQVIQENPGDYEGCCLNEQTGGVDYLAIQLQTFIPSTPNPVSFSVYFSYIYGPMDFVGYIYEWDTTNLKVVGAPLFTGAKQTAPKSISDEVYELKWAVSGVELDVKKVYALAARVDSIGGTDTCNVRHSSVANGGVIRSFYSSYGIDAIREIDFPHQYTIVYNPAAPKDITIKFSNNFVGTVTFPAGGAGTSGLTFRLASSDRNSYAGRTLYVTRNQQYQSNPDLIGCDANSRKIYASQATTDGVSWVFPSSVSFDFANNKYYFYLKPLNKGTTNPCFTNA